MAGPPFDRDDDLGTAPADVLARAKRVGPDFDLAPDPESEHEPEPWEIPPSPPPPPRLREQSVEDVFVRLRVLTLPQARAFLRAYRQIPRSELNVGGWAPGLGATAQGAGDPPSMDEIVRGRASLREGAVREARANGADAEVEALSARADDTLVDALSHASLRGGGLEEATVAAQVAARDAVVALALRPWISNWRFEELVQPWATAFTVEAAEAHSFDVLGAVALAFGVMALATLGVGQSSVGAPDLPTLVFGALAVIVLVVRWRLRRQPAANAEG